jgi:hypothetical protein
MEYHVNQLGLKSPDSCFVCQIADPAQVEEWSAGIDALDTQARERHWCAMCAVRMLLLAEGLTAPSLEQLFEQARDFGVYRADPAIGWKGAYHQELAKFVANFGFTAHAVRCMSPHHGKSLRWSIGQWIGFGHYVLLSAHPDIRLRSSEPPPTKRGHIVFVYGYEILAGQEYYWLNNSAGFLSQQSQAGMRISAERLAQVSCGDGVVVQKRNLRQRLW